MDGEGGLGALGEIRTPDPRNRNDVVWHRLSVGLQGFCGLQTFVLGLFLGLDVSRSGFHNGANVIDLNVSVVLRRGRDLGVAEKELGCLEVPRFAYCPRSRCVAHVVYPRIDAGLGPRPALVAAEAIIGDGIALTADEVLTRHWAAARALGNEGEHELRMMAAAGP